MKEKENQNNKNLLKKVSSFLAGLSLNVLIFASPAFATSSTRNSKVVNNQSTISSYSSSEYRKLYHTKDYRPKKNNVKKTKEINNNLENLAEAQSEYKRWVEIFLSNYYNFMPKDISNVRVYAKPKTGVLQSNNLEQLIFLKPQEPKAISKIGIDSNFVVTQFSSNEMFRYLLIGIALSAFHRNTRVRKLLQIKGGNNHLENSFERKEKQKSKSGSLRLEKRLMYELLILFLLVTILFYIFWQLQLKISNEFICKNLLQQARQQVSIYDKLLKVSGLIFKNIYNLSELVEMESVQSTDPNFDAKYQEIVRMVEKYVKALAFEGLFELG